MTAPRYAIYFAPEEGMALASFGWSWLGRSPTSLEPVALPALGLEPERHAMAVAAPRLYGFHATLKPPFRLAAGREAAALADALRRFAAGQRPFKTAPLVLGEMDGFLALLLRTSAPELGALAAACVEAFDSFRAPPGEAELAKRRARGLTVRQQDLLARWGYPYVMEEFRFHMTLTDRLDDPARATIRGLIASRLGAVESEPLAVRSICLFKQTESGGWFRLTERFPFGD